MPSSQFDLRGDRVTYPGHGVREFFLFSKALKTFQRFFVL